MSPLHGDETYVLDACVVIDFCGRTANLQHLRVYVGDAAVVTSEVMTELEGQHKNFHRLGEFLDLVKAGTVQVVDPDLTDADVIRIIRKWSGQFGLGEVSSAALAISRHWVFVSRDRAPMQQLRLSETIMMESTNDVLSGLARRGVISKTQSERIMKDIHAGSRRRC